MREKIVDKRPWGMFEQFTENEKSTVKLLFVKAGKRISYQFHNHRSEFWRIVSGKALVTLNGKNRIMKSGDEVMIPLRAKHRVKGITDAVILEIATGDFDEADVVRIQDDFGRHEANAGLNLKGGQSVMLGKSGK
jgi:mannose-6-phosphate isomerase